MIREPYSMTGTPRANSGTRIMSMREVAEMMANNPRAREAVERINRFEGKPRLAEKIVHEEYHKNRVRELNNRFQIDAALKKQRGELG